MANLRLKELRQQSNLTQIELSNKLKLNQVRYNHYEQNKNEPNIDILISIANFYNVSLDYLCNRKFKDEIGYLTEMQKQIVQILKQLNNENTIQAFGYLNGLLAGQ